jgi:hypothetical protein
LEVGSGYNKSEKLDADPHWSQNSKWLERLKIEALRGMDAYNAGLEAQNGALGGLDTSGRRFPLL